MRTATVLVVLTSIGMCGCLGTTMVNAPGQKASISRYAIGGTFDRNLIEIGDVGDQDRDRFFGRAFFGDVQLQHGGPIEGQRAQAIHRIGRKRDEAMFAQQLRGEIELDRVQAVGSSWLIDAQHFDINHGVAVEGEAHAFTVAAGRVIGKARAGRQTADGARFDDAAMADDQRAAAVGQGAHDRAQQLSQRLRVLCHHRTVCARP